MPVYIRSLIKLKILTKNHMKKLPDILYYLTPLIIGFTYFAIVVNTVGSSGYTGKYYFIELKFLLALAISFLLFTRKRSHLLEIILKINIIVFFISAVLYIVFLYFEITHYQSLIFNVYIFNLRGLIMLVFFSFSLFLADKYKKNIEKIFDKYGFKQLFGVFLIIYVMLDIVGTPFRDSLNGNIYIFTHLRDSYDQKMQSKWGDFYDYMVFVKNNTPEDSSIIVPPKIIPWLKTGNMPLLTYFLFPRNLIQYDSVEIPNPESVPKGTYVMIAWGGWDCVMVAQGDWDCDPGICNIWPRQKMKAKKVIYKVSKSSKVKEVRENIIYDPKDTTNPYGLLKI